jgi:hypothetical protein
MIARIRAGRYQQVFGKYGFDYVMDCEALGVGRRAHDSLVHRVKSLPNGWHGWCIDIKYLVDGRVVMPRAWGGFNEFMLAIFIEWVRKTVRRKVAE